MNEQNQNILIEDLAAPNAAEVKGGPSTQSHRDVILKTSFSGQHQVLTDLEPQADVVGGQTREHILLARQVGTP